MRLHWLIVAAALMVLCTSLCAQDASKPRVMNWKQFPLPTGTPDTPRPPDSEFLKVLPPLRQEPAFSAKAWELGVAVWWADYSVQLFSEQPPSKADFARKPIVRAVAGEDEPLVLGLWGIGDVGKVTLSVKKSPFPITIRCVDFYPRTVPGPYFEDKVEGGRTVGIAAYLPIKNTAEVKAKANTVFWMTVQVPSSAKPGKYPAKLELAVGESGNVVVLLPVTIVVLPIKLPPADIAYGMYFRPTDTKAVDPRFATPGKLQEYWRDLAKHGMNSPTLYNCAGPVYDSDGNAKFDGNSDIAMIQDWLKAGCANPKVPMMFLGGISDKAAASVKAEAKRRGFPEFLVYGPDEPAVNDQSLASFNALQPVRKSFRIVTAISDSSAAAYGDLLDVWVVNGGRVTPEMRKLAAQKKAELWTYDCSHRGMGNAPWSRYYAGLYTWALGLKGNFLWCYTEGYYREKGVHLPWSPIFCYVLPSDQGLLPSIEWEARREGVEDYRTLALLEKLIPAKPTNPTARQAKTWLEKTRNRVDWYLARNMPPSMYPWDGPELYPMCPNFDQTELSSIRTKAQDYVLKLK